MKQVDDLLNTFKFPPTQVWYDPITNEIFLDYWAQSAIYYWFTTEPIYLGSL